MEKAQFAILRFAKYKGPTISRIEAHNERTKEFYASNPDIKTELSKYNFHLVKPSGKYREEANRLIREAGCKARKDSVRLVETLITASPEFFAGKKPGEIRDFFEHALEFLKTKQAEDTIVSAVVHVDEKTPHMHLCFVPITADGRLSAKEIVGNKKKLTQWQDEYWKHMVKEYPDFERGESASLTGRTHLPPRIFKQATRMHRLEQKLRELLSSINPMNAKWVREEILKILDEYIPGVAELMTKTKALKRVEKEQKAEIAQLRYHPNWTVVGKYIDEGITGTQAKKRPAFLRMLEDARAGKFDLIVTREVCRFARNTVDTLVHTRELKNIGVEVYFVEDNIWTMDGDGELRLSLMATLAQEESRKVSERVRAGQKVSREKGTLYGSGNILGYERVGSTYVINPDQAETVRMIFEMYLNEGIGTGKIANRLTEMGRLNASGLNKWSHGVVSRVLNNQTYMGIMAYGKSYNNNYLDQKRINNHDQSSYICVEGDFPPIVTPEEWYRAQEIKAGRVKESFSAKKGKKTTHCVQENRDLWGSRLRCTCGCGFRKNVWHKYDDKPNTYGYQCYNILNNGSANQRRKAGADDTGYCDQPMIADWKLELMGKKILELVFQDKRDLIDHTCDMIRKCLQTARPQGVTLSNIVGKMERIKFKKEMLLEMRTDGEITKQEFLDQRKKLDKELQELQAEYDSKSCSPATEMDQPEWGKIQTALEEILDLSQPTPSPDLIRKFVAQIVPEGKTNFQWHLNLDGNQTTHVGMTVEGRKNKAVVSFAAEGTCSPLAFGAVIEYPTLCRAATDKNAYLSAMQDRLPSRANHDTNSPGFGRG